VRGDADVPLQLEDFKLDTSEDAYYNLWHTHVDWHGEGNNNSNKRDEFLSVLFAMFSSALSQRDWLKKPCNIWLLIDISNSANDSLYIHTPNPHTEFPYSFEEVQWNVETPKLIIKYVKDTYEIGISKSNANLLWIREKDEKES
jgi:hypothetical protein